MYLLILSQNNKDNTIGLFQSIEEGREFSSKIPGYSKSEEEFDGETFIYEYIDPSKLSDYQEIEFNGNIIPITKLSFDLDEDIDIIYKEIQDISKPNQGMLMSSTRVDAYMVNNEELKDYISDRENAFKLVKKILEKKGYDVDRNFYGSEDGEAVVYKEKNSQDWHFLMHMDPMFVEDIPKDEKELESMLNDYIEN